MTIEPTPGKPNWPADWQGCTFTGKYVDLNGDPMQGFIEYSMDIDRAISYAFSTTVIAAMRRVALDENGAFEITVPATDDPQIVPYGFTYTIKENFPGGVTHTVTAPMNQTIDLTGVVSVPPDPGIVHVWTYPIHVLQAGETEADIPPTFPSDGLVFQKLA